MSSSKDIRCSIILESLPGLIEELSGVKRSTEGFSRLEHHVLSKIQNHNYLSVNGHEIQRRMDSVVERFTDANYSIYGKHLEELVDKVKDDPLCKDHYESDIHWALMSFLLELSQNPVAGLEKNKHRIQLGRAKGSDDNQPAQNTVDSESETNPVEINRVKLDSTEDLSEWSDSDDGNESNDDNYMESIVENITSEFTIKDDAVSENKDYPGIRPPLKSENFQQFDCDKDRMLGWWKENIQPAWWSNREWQKPTSSTHPGAMFCHFWAKHIANIQNVELIPITTLSEYCMIKEILWMFIVPKTCKTFVVNDLESTVSVAENVSINSVSLYGIQTFLQYFSRLMTMVLRLKTFCGYVNGGTHKSPPHSYEAYVQSLQQCMRPFNDFIVNKETEFSRQKDDGSDLMSSLIRLHRDMEPYGSFLDNLFDIHCTSTLDYVKYPAHVCSSYLIAALVRAHTNSSSKCHSNLAAVLFMGTIKVYLQIIDTWWTDGRLEDWQNEFVIKNVEHMSDVNSPEHGDDYEVRMLSSKQDQTCIIPENVATVIKSCVLTKLICKYALQAGYTLNILHALDRIGEIKSQSGYPDNLYESFLKLTKAKVAQYKVSNSPPIPSSMTETSIHQVSKKIMSKDVNSFRSSATSHNPLLALVFEFSLKKCDTSHSMSDYSLQDANKPMSEQIDEDDAYQMYELWQTSSSTMLPFDDIIIQNLSSLLKSRIATANRCVVNMYMDEYLVLNHLHNLAKVYFLGAGDLMFLFFSNLFKQIETTDNWNEPYLLTDHLNGIICTKFPDMSSLFSVHVSSRKFAQRNVLDAIKNISISYSAPSCLQDIISDSCLTKYNEVFRCLLKIKWALFSLENLRFPIVQKKRRPYVKMSFFDLTFKRLALVRFWIQNTLQCLHSHLMTEVVQTMVDQLDARLAECTTLPCIVAAHKLHINTIHNHCFLSKDDRNVMIGIEQLLTLVCVVRNEWANLDDYAEDSQIDAVEESFIHCHQYISGVLNTQLYSKNQTHLSALCAAFSSSCPY